MALTIPNFFGIFRTTDPAVSPARSALTRYKFGLSKPVEQLSLPIQEADGHWAVGAAWNLIFRAGLLVTPQVQRRVVQDGKVEWEPVENHPFYDVWHAGSQNESTAELLGSIWWGYILFGEAFIRILRNGSTRPIGWTVMPLQIEANRGAAGRGKVRVSFDKRTETLSYEYQNFLGAKEDVTSDTIHLRWGLSADNKFRGQPPLLPILDLLFLSKAATQYWAVRFDNPSQLDFIVSAVPNPNALNVNPPHTAKELEATANAIQERATGLTPQKILPIDEAIEVNPVSMRPIDMEINDALREAEYAVAAQLGMDPDDLQFKAGLQDSHSYASVVEARQKTWQDGLIPILTILAQALTARFLPEFPGSNGLRIEWDYSHVRALNPLNHQNNLAAFGALKDANVLDTNELRALIGYPPLTPEQEAERESRQPDAPEEGEEGEQEEE